MVWGWVEPSSFGDYFPGGDYVGWEEAIKRYFDEEMSAEQRGAYDNWDVAYRGDVARKFNEEGRGPIEPHELPLEYRLRETPKSLGSIILMTNGFLAVDAALHDIIERLEPGVHQFWPLRITTRKGQEHPVPYHGMVVRRWIDSFVPEQSTGLSDGYFAIHPTKKGYSDITVLKSASAGAHLWREHRLRRPELLFSDELQAEIARRGLRIAKHHKLNAI